MTMPRKSLCHLMLALVAALAMSVVPATPPVQASADDCFMGVNDDLESYGRVCPEEKAASTPAGSPVKAAPPSCDLGKHMTYCRGTDACLNVKEDTSAPGYTPPPSPRPAGAQAYTRACIDKNGYDVMTMTGITLDSVWLTPAQAAVNLAVAARQAVASIKLPKLSLATSPAQMTAVNADTRWWAPGASSQAIKGGSALGLVATATPV
ncbi:MAG: hypothetical protein ACRC0L_04785, partial [Angustibacter sp.]